MDFGRDGGRWVGLLLLSLLDEVGEVLEKVKRAAEDEGGKAEGVGDVVGVVLVEVSVVGWKPVQVVGLE